METATGSGEVGTTAAKRDARECDPEGRKRDKGRDREDGRPDVKNRD